MSKAEQGLVGTSKDEQGLAGNEKRTGCQKKISLLFRANPFYSVLIRGKGFTLMELMVVIVITAIVSATVIVTGQGFLNKAAVKNATRDIASVMRIAHSKAGALKKDYVVVFDNQEPPDTQARVWAQPLDGFDADDPSTWNPVFGTEKKLSKRAQIAGVNVSYDGTPDKSSGDWQEVDDPCQVGYLPFRWDGTSVSGSVNLQDTKGNNQYKVTVMYSTSRARIYDTWD